MYPFPPLRDRKEDIPVLVDALLKRLNSQLGVNVLCVSPVVMKLLVNYNWPGNIRELQNVLERAMNIAWGDTLDINHFTWFIENKGLAEEKTNGFSLRRKKRTTEKEAILEALQICQGNRGQAARLLDISRTMLYKKLRQHKI